MSTPPQGQGGTLRGTVVLLNADNTPQSGTVPLNDTNLKTYSLAENSYAKIMLISTIQINMALTSIAQDLIINAKVGSSIKPYTFSISAMAQKRTFSITFDAVQTAAATIAISHDGTTADANTTTFIQSLYVYGIV